MRTILALRSHPVLSLVSLLLALFTAPTRGGAQTETAGATAAVASPAPFSFIAIGCMPYGRLADSSAAYGRVLAEINRHNPAFAIHLGDLFGSEELATDELLIRRRDEFNTVVPPMIFTPGDNEWTDVHRTANGRYQPLERLARIRELFFPEEKSLGKHPLSLITQRRDPVRAKFVENSRWILGNVLFATVHVVGSSNNRQPTIPGAMEEWKERDEANAVWIRETFAEARSRSTPGVALFCQANPSPENPGFALFLETLRSEARTFGKPVLLVHADEHRFRLDSLSQSRAGQPSVPRLTRLETFGATDFHGVIVVVDPGSTDVFLPGPLYVPGNSLPKLPRPTPPATAAVKPAQTQVATPKR